MSDRVLTGRNARLCSIFLSPILLSPVFLSLGFNQWGAGKARAGLFVLLTVEFLFSRADSQASDC